MAHQTTIAQAAGFTPGSPAAIAYLNHLLARRGVDTAAADRVFGVEGLHGGIGDGGHAFGPGQFNDAGGVWTGRYAGMSPEQKNAAAWSPAGLEELAARVAAVARGEHGARAVEDIVTRFERPADPRGEISRALGAPIGGGAAGTLSAGTGVAAAPGTDPRRAFAQALLSAISPTGQLDDAGLSGAITARRQAVIPFSPSPAGDTSTPTPAAGKGGILELLKEGVGGPTHSTGQHIHAAFASPQLELAAINYAQQHGLHVGENPYVGDTVDPVHAPHSYHTRDFPGLFNGRKLGQAIDVSGPGMDAFYAWLAGRRS
jgi:hypothetical protein